MPNEWDLILGENPDDQARMLSRMLRQEREVGNIAGLVGGKSFGPWGLAMAKGAQDDQGRLALAARVRQQAMLQRAQLAQQQAQLASQDAYHKGQLSIAEGRNQIEKARLAAEKEWRANALASAERIAGIKANKGAGSGPYAGLPRQIAKDLIATDQNIAGLEKALSVVKASPQSFGAKKEASAYMPWGVGSKMVRSAQNARRPPGEAKARSFIYGPVAKIIHDVFGSAVTATEENRTNFLPQENDDARRVAEKLTAALWEAKKNRAAIVKGFQANPGEAAQEATPVPVSGSAPATMEDLLQYFDSGG